MIDTLSARIHVLAKPTGARCNLACSYCFFLDKERLYPGSTFRMCERTLETYIRQLVNAHQSQKVAVAWQGGEPTLMGLDFYRKAIEFQEKYGRPGMTFENTMQTNGTLLNDEWCRFFKENDFLIGISLDGPQALHDAYRVDKAGRGTFKRVMRGLQLLQKHGVEYNILATVNRINADFPLEVYRFMRDEVGARWVQFIPVVERLNVAEHFRHGNVVSERSVQPEQFGNFLNAVFDEWVHLDVGRMFVQLFEAAACRWMGLPSSGMCIFEPTCGTGVALEHNGDLYSCDHFVEPDYKLGNIHQSSIGQMVASSRQQKFGHDKADTLPAQCRNCEVLFLCQGECPKNRFLKTIDGEYGLNYLCAGWHSFFSHIRRPMEIITGLLRAGRPAAEVMQILAQEQSALKARIARSGRNDPCPCGSGLKLKRCHGHVRVNGVPRAQDWNIQPGKPRPRPVCNGPDPTEIKSNKVMRNEG